MSLKISRSKWEHVVLVTDDISHDCLLGTDFLIAHKFNIIVDLEQNKIFFGGVKVMYNNYYSLSIDVLLCS